MGGSNVTAAGAAAGIFLGWDEVTTSAYKMFIGTTSGDFLKFDGTNLTMGGGVEIGTTGYLRTAGKTTYADTDAGIWIGYDDSAYKLNIGDATNYLKWSGTAVSISCASGSGLTMLAGSDITLTGHPTNAARIVFTGTGNEIAIEAIASGSGLYIGPRDDTEGDIGIGKGISSGTVATAGLYGTTAVYLTAPTVYVTGNLRPDADDSRLLGVSTQPWLTVFANKIKLKEVSAPDTDAGFGILWTNDSNELWFRAGNGTTTKIV